MREGPDIARVGTVIGDPARAAMLVALMDGKALTAKELAAEAGVTASTASSHLRKLENNDLLVQRKQGRHRYYALKNEDVGRVVDALLGLAEVSGHRRTRTGPTDPALRTARVCYNHLAGAMGVAMFDSLYRRDFLQLSDQDGEVTLSTAGTAFFQQFGMDLDRLSAMRRPMCRACLDWSERRSHLAGPLAEAILAHMLDAKWAKRIPNSRAIHFTAAGLSQFKSHFPTPNTN